MPRQTPYQYTAPLSYPSAILLQTQVTPRSASYPAPPHVSHYPSPAPLPHTLPTQVLHGSSSSPAPHLQFNPYYRLLTPVVPQWLPLTTTPATPLNQVPPVQYPFMPYNPYPRYR